MLASYEIIVLASEGSFRCFERAESSFAFQWHYHCEVELTLIVQGSGRRFVGDHVEPYRRGDLVLLGPNLPHTWVSDHEPHQQDGTEQAVVIQFCENFLGDRFFEATELQETAGLLNRSQRGLKFSDASVESVWEPIIAMPHQSGSERLISLLTVLDRLAVSSDPLPLASEGYVPSLRKTEQSRLEDVFGYMNDHFTEPLTQSQLAERLGMNPSSFSRFFKKATGRTMTEYLSDLRVGLACRLLLETDLSVLEICHRVGFNNVSNFNRRFRTLKNMTPRAFRSQYATALR